MIRRISPESTDDRRRWWCNFFFNLSCMRWLNELRRLSFELRMLRLFPPSIRGWLKNLRNHQLSHISLWSFPFSLEYPNWNLPLRLSLFQSVLSQKTFHFNLIWDILVESFYLVSLLHGYDDKTFCYVDSTIRINYKKFLLNPMFWSESVHRYVCAVCCRNVNLLCCVYEKLSVTLALMHGRNPIVADCSSSSSFRSSLPFMSCSSIPFRLMICKLL